jgi:hypothetical protein
LVNDGAAHYSLTGPAQSAHRQLLSGTRGLPSTTALLLLLEHRVCLRTAAIPSLSEFLFVLYCDESELQAEYHIFPSFFVFFHFFHHHHHHILLLLLVLLLFV